ncbi:ATP-binding protein [Orenia marismortui]|uniref:Replicative DNA helicase loader DnaI n=1 Tax=Orenia marismortui TaxID=46469 RepID=A0A4R8H357_9FIRM|nr:ATP-binding protein [Orenia marismortui]TDX49126.1 replicative DNA helicase loader DnaI [Orenia marismortui]
MKPQNFKRSMYQSTNSNPVNKIKQIKWKQAWELQNGNADKTQFSCNICCDKKIVVKKEGDNFTADDCKCLEQKKLKDRKQKEQKKYENSIKAAEIREEFEGKTFDDFKWLKGKKEAKYAAMDYVENFDFYQSKGIGLTFVGKCGRGKTLLSHIISQELLKKDHTVVNVVAKEFYDDIKATYDDPDKKTSDLITSAKEVDLLVIDNLNSQRFGFDEIDKLFIIINHRIENKRPTIINSTCSLDSLEKKLAPDHVSRLIGKNGDPIQISGIDMRKKHGEAITKLRQQNIGKLKNKTI